MRTFPHLEVKRLWSRSCLRRAHKPATDLAGTSSTFGLSVAKRVRSGCRGMLRLLSSPTGFWRQLLLAFLLSVAATGVGVGLSHAHEPTLVTTEPAGADGDFPGDRSVGATTAVVTNVGLDTRYDDDSGTIERDEILQAVRDHFAGGPDAPGREEILELISIYLSGQDCQLLAG